MQLVLHQAVIMLINVIFFPPIALKKCYFGCKRLKKPHRINMEGFIVST